MTDWYNEELHQHYFNQLTSNGIDEDRADLCALILIRDAMGIERTEAQQELISGVYADLDWSLVA